MTKKFANWAEVFEDHGRQQGAQQEMQRNLTKLRSLLKRALDKPAGALPVAIAERIDQARSGRALVGTDGR